MNSIEKTTMQAALWTAYGPPEVLKLAKVNVPQPKEHEVLVKIRAASAFVGDCELRRFDIPMRSLWLPLRLLLGVFKPRGQRILGQEFAGEVVAVGSNVTEFTCGDHIFGSTDFSFGAYAQYACFPARGARALMPKNMSFEQAATVPTGGINALHFLQLANIQHGERVLIIGAGGCIGTYAVQIARALGAQVTAIDRGNMRDTLLSLGASEAIDLSDTDIYHTQKRYDVVFDVIGKPSFNDCLRVLKPTGRYLCANGTIWRRLQGAITQWFTRKQCIFTLAPLTAELLNTLRQLIENKDVHAVIDRHFTLETIVEAHRFVDTRTKIGHVAVTVEHQSE